MNYKCDEEGTALNYEVISAAVCSVRSAQPLSADWKRRIDEDVKKGVDNFRQLQATTPLNFCHAISKE